MFKGSWTESNHLPCSVTDHRLSSVTQILEQSGHKNYASGTKVVKLVGFCGSFMG